MDDVSLFADSFFSFVATLNLYCNDMNEYHLLL